MQFRKNEPERVWFRSSRCFCVGEKWYFSTREGVDVGPFGSREKADRAVNRYVESIKLGRKSGIYAAKLASDGLWASTGFN